MHLTPLLSSENSGPICSCKLRATCEVLIAYMLKPWCKKTSVNSTESTFQNLVLCAYSVCFNETIH